MIRLPACLDHEGAKDTKTHEEEKSRSEETAKTAECAEKEILCARLRVLCALGGFFLS
jgi:hypothetical protein